MKVEEFLKSFQLHPLFEEFGQKFYSSNSPLTHIKKTNDSFLALLLCSTLQKEWRTTLVVFPTEEEALFFVSDCDQYLSKDQVLYIPAALEEKNGVVAKNNHLIQERTEALNKLLNSNKNRIAVTHAAAILEPTPSGNRLEKSSMQLKKGDIADFDFMTEYLVEHDFERVDFVYEPGQFALRGGIIDVFSFSGKEPIRVEFDGDEVESIRTFDPISQLSTSKLEFFQIVPKMESQKGEEFNICDYLSNDSVIFTKNTKDFKEVYEILISQIGEDETNDLLSFDYITTKFKNYSQFEFGTRFSYRAGKDIDFKIEPIPDYRKNFQFFIDKLESNHKEGIKSYVLSESAKQLERLHNILEEKKVTSLYEPILSGLASGFIDPSVKIACFTDHQIFGRHYSHKYKKRYSKSAALSLRELKNLQPGDFVTHIDHGIGKFGGLERIDVNGKIQEAVRLTYKNGDLLYVNIHSLHKISKFSGKEGVHPSMNKLGTGAWDKKKVNTKKKVKDIARELIKLYALRKGKKGFAFSPDSYLQHELEASFLYEDTPDQATASQDVKTDMESTIPMDRLVCGDVGFGKTEVAIRAAAKAVADSKQVAILVPTTILAFQHYKNFKERMKGFPANIDYINRFKSKKEQTETIKKIKEGKTDILIGTHRIVSKDVGFKDLGLLIIDEEQKFGVGVKEKLKQLKVDVDTLTLTATPIPRTLHFSLMGARDLSVINTPPPNRIPIETDLQVYSKETIEKAILKEIARDGQVFFVHNRVKDIYEVATNLEDMCPGIKVGVGHGQLEGHELEAVMMKFIAGDYDVLVATTIIESGLDIPNANTIIINNAHLFGLSDLHQMRGRVGRSNRKAYCYLMTPTIHALPEDAKRRLRAIEEFHDLGSGFNVAMRDLDIRGAGNLLGGEQSGFISEMGFDMYHKILDEAVAELKEEEFSNLFEQEQKKYTSRDCAVETTFSAIIPVHYVGETTERLALYNEIAVLKDEEELLAFASKLEDRFGKTPQELQLLYNTVRLKWAGMQLGLEKIWMDGKTMKWYCPANQNSPFYTSNKFHALMGIAAKFPSKCSIKESSKGLIIYLRSVVHVGEALGLLRDVT
jgi:transcription-repair coupling factor (superfamily II helicase)